MATITQIMRRAKYKATPETLTVGALDVTTKGLSYLNISGTKAFTLPDGLYEGQDKEVVCVGAASTPAGTLTPATPYGYASVLFDAVGESCFFRWHVGKGWSILGRGALAAGGATVQ